eukprot:4924531-Amphidinium_carterae.1
MARPQGKALQKGTKYFSGGRAPYGKGQGKGRRGSPRGSQCNCAAFHKLIKKTEANPALNVC